MMKCSMGHKSSIETQTYMHLTKEEFDTTMARFTNNETTDTFAELLSKVNLSEEKINAIKNIINN